jgi:hypothetical protein
MLFKEYQCELTEIRQLILVIMSYNIGRDSHGILMERNEIRLVGIQIPIAKSDYLGIIFYINSRRYHCTL